MKKSKHKKKQKQGTPKEAVGSSSFGKKMAEGFELPRTLAATNDIDLHPEALFQANPLSTRTKQGVSMSSSAPGTKSGKQKKDLSRSGFTAQRHSVPKNYHR